mgnify:CR=1 FL=1
MSGLRAVRALQPTVGDEDDNGIGNGNGNNDPYSDNDDFDDFDNESLEDDIESIPEDDDVNNGNDGDSIESDILTADAVERKQIANDNVGDTFNGEPSPSPQGHTARETKTAVDVTPVNPTSDRYGNDFESDDEFDDDDYDDDDDQQGQYADDDSLKAVAPIKTKASAADAVALTMNNHDQPTTAVFSDEAVSNATNSASFLTPQVSAIEPDEAVAEAIQLVQRKHGTEPTAKIVSKWLTAQQAHPPPQPANLPVQTTGVTEARKKARQKMASLQQFKRRKTVEVLHCSLLNKDNNNHNNNHNDKPVRLKPCPATLDSPNIWVLSLPRTVDSGKKATSHRRILLLWAAPSAASEIKSFTIERQSEDADVEQGVAPPLVEVCMHVRIAD